MEDQTRPAPARPRKAQPKATQPKATASEPMPTKSTAPTKRAPRKSAAKVDRAEVLDDKMLAHLDGVLAELDPPMVTATLAAPPAPSRAPLWARVVADPGFAAE